MSYSGNPALSPDVQQRIRSTFDHTLGLAAAGSRQEALLGCDFVLRMDPQFEPARRLQERLGLGIGPVRVDDMGGANVAAVPFDDLAGLSLELPDLPEAPPVDPRELGAELQGLLRDRRFQELLTRAERDRTVVGAHHELQQLVDAAHERMEAGPYVNKFITSAREARRSGNTTEAQRLLEKARSLDPTHPGLDEPAEPPRSTREFDKTTTFDLSSIEPSTDFAAFSGALAAPANDGDERIQLLLDEGQAALDGGDPQAAIDVWSRIFLIDIDCHEASRRIEQARRVKAEAERQAEEAFHDGIGKVEARDLAGARRAFERVLDLQPGHLAAREYLQQLDAGTLPMTSGAGNETARPGAAARSVAPAADLHEEIMVPPDLGKSAAKPVAGKTAKAPAAPRGRDGRAFWLFVGVGSAVLLLVLSVAFYVYFHRDHLFPNSKSDEVAPATPAPNPIARATALHSAGKTAIAISQLRRLPANDPHYKEAQDLIAQWEKETLAPMAPAATAPAAGTVGAVAPAQLSEPAPAADAAAKRQTLIAAARKAYAEGDNISTVDQLGRAGQIGKLEGPDADQLAAAQHRLEPLAKPLTLFRQHDWEYALHDLWLAHEADPGNKDVTKLIVDSYYDLGVRDLKSGDLVKAADKFGEGLKLRADDPQLARTRQFAQAYQDRPKDLLFQIFVKYLPLR